MVNVKLIRIVAITLATLASSLSVVMAGIIGWVGLIIPHIIRMAVGPSHRLLIPLSAIVGGAFLLLADAISRLALSVEIPIGILTSLIGIPIFIIVLKNARAVVELKPIISVKDLHFSYKNHHVLSGINLELYKGEIVSLLGPNGLWKEHAYKTHL